MAEIDKKTGKLGKPALIAIATGQVIGAGVITVTGQAIGATGKSAWIAYGAAVILGLIVILPILFYSSVVKYRGGQYTIVASLMGEKWGGIYALSYIPMWISLGLVGSSLGIYINSLFPFIDARVASIVLLTVFLVLNLFGISIMSSIQNIMTSFLIVCLIGFALIGFGKLLPGTFAISEPNYFSGGAGGFMDAIILLVYSTTGQAFVAAFSNDAKDPKKDIPFAMLGATGIITVIYIAVAIVAAGVLPIDVVAGKPLTLVAKEILPAPLFVVFMIGGPIMALATTINSGFHAVAAPVLTGIRDGWMPKALAKTNKYNVPYIVYVIIYLVGILPLVLGFSLKVLTNNTVLVNYITKILVIVAMFFMPKIFGEHWEKSPYHVSNPIYYTLMTISLVAQIGIIILSAKALSTGLLLSNIAIIALLAGYALYRHKANKVKMNANYTFD